MLQSAFARILRNLLQDREHGFVSDYIYSDACAYSETVEAYRRGLAAADRALAAACDRVIEINGGMEEIWK